VARSMGMCNHIWSFKCCLQFSSKFMHNYEIVISFRSKGNADISVACLCVRYR
jgi:hypothetical protein